LLESIAGQSFTIICVLVAALAAWKGAGPERVGAVTVMAATVGSFTLQRRSAWLEPQYGILLVDGLLLGFFFVWMLRTRRWWPVAATAFMLLTVLSHLAFVLTDGVGGWAYIGALNLWAYMVLGALAFGVFEARQERRAMRTA
jgi:hypothetical protein